MSTLIYGQGLINALAGSKSTTSYASFMFHDHNGQVSNIDLSGHFLPEWAEKLRQEERAAK